MSCSAFADFSSTDSANLTTIKNAVRTNINGNSYTCVDLLYDIFAELALHIEPDLTSIRNTVSANLSLITQYAGGINDKLVYGQSAAYWLSMLDSRTSGTNSRLDINNTRLDTINQTLRDTLIYGQSAAYWLSMLDSRTTGINNRLDINNSSLSNIFDLLNVDYEKQEDSLDSYSSAGGRSASDVSSDMGNISGSVSSNLDSGVSMDKALTAVDDNDSYFHYFFFEMHDDLDTSTSNGLLRAPRPGQGDYVPDFVHDYWGGLNG